MFSGGKPAGGLLNWRVEREDIPLSESELQSEIDAYDCGAAYADASLGALLEALEARGLADNLLVVVTSDHGEALGEHGLYLHANSLYRSVIRVPLILWRSGPALPAEVRVAQPVSNSWVGATIMDLVNPAMQSTIPGPSLASLWNNSQVDAAVFPDPLAEMRQQDWKPEHFPTQSGDIASLITADWQYIEHSRDGAALFDLNTDPLGLTDIGAQPQNQTILEQMRAALQALLSQVGSAAIQRFSLAR
jgi:arylsulfatase A-like enzyme